MSNPPTLDPIAARKVLEEYALRHADLTTVTEQKFIDFSADLFKQQRDFIKSPAKKKIALCGRRGGKSTTCAYYCVETGYLKKCSVAYIALSRQAAKDILWHEVMNILDRYKIPYDTDLSALQFRLGNGSIIGFYGASSEREIEKFRGMHFELVIVDEASRPQFLPLLDSLLYEVIGPTLFDTDGTICLISSPGPICSGIFYRITEGLVGGWDVHRWTVKDNPKLPRWRNKANWRQQAEALLEELKTEHGWDNESPIYRREWLGQWVKESISLVYKFDSATNTFSDLPTDIKEWQYLFGIDFGVVDSSAIVVGAYSAESPVLWIVDCFKQNSLSPSELADIIKTYYEKYNPVAIDADANGMGLSFITEIEKRHQLPIDKAEKKDKVGFIELINDEFRRGKIKIKENLTDLQEELSTFQWLDIQRKLLPKEANDHCCDALLYMWRKSLHYIGKTPDAPVKVGSVEWEQQLFSDVKDTLNKKLTENWWDEL